MGQSVGQLISLSVRTQQNERYLLSFQRRPLPVVVLATDTIFSSEIMEIINEVVENTILQTTRTIRQTACILNNITNQTSQSSGIRFPKRTPKIMTRNSVVSSENSAVMY
jgi:hypothetical protein